MSCLGKARGRRRCASIHVYNHSAHVFSCICIKCCACAACAKWAPAPRRRRGNGSLNVTGQLILNMLDLMHDMCDDMLRAVFKHMSYAPMDRYIAGGLFFRPLDWESSDGNLESDAWCLIVPTKPRPGQMPPDHGGEPPVKRAGSHVFDFELHSGFRSGRDSEP